MEFRQLGRSGLMVPALSFGTFTFGGTERPWGNTDPAEARHLIDVCLDNGISFFDTADSYSNGESEIFLGDAISGRRNEVLLATKAGFPTGEGPNRSGASRQHLVDSCHQSLRRLRVDHIDVFFVHRDDPFTPIEETLDALDRLVASGKVRYVGCSNLPAWKVARSVATADARGLARYVAYQSYYSLIGRDCEVELLPMTMSEGLGMIAWSPLGWGRLTGKLRRNEEPASGRIHAGGAAGGPPVDRDRLDSVVDALEQVARDIGKTIAQVAMNWIVSRPGIASVIIGARTEQQLRENLDALGWHLHADHMNLLEKVSAVTPPYPHWPQFKGR